MAEKTLEFQTTLVRYNNPTLVIKHDDKKGEKDVRFASRLRVGTENNFSFVLGSSEESERRPPDVGKHWRHSQGNRRDLELDSASALLGR